ncbi:MAG: acetate/propionate family kinase [Candidatus Glassbacteria bacterium]|nr:acetate/propionate family kinase [Candidatus Glassbacteria bacterium]
MNVMVLNCGSSSLKYRLIEMPSERELAGGEARNVGPPTASPPCIVHHSGNVKETRMVALPDHGRAFREVMNLLLEDNGPRPEALGHRMVHGGDLFTDPVVVRGSVLEQLDRISHLAPLHNPPAVSLIGACREMYPELPQVAVFDTAFHSTIPGYASTYALPESLRLGRGIRKYGFHGTSHQFVAGEAARFLGIPPVELNAVSCHLGSGGASLCAIVRGRSVDNTMGYSPLQGLVMSTRSGDLDPGLVLRLLDRSNGNGKELEKTLNKHSGVLGLSGDSAEIRDVFAALAAPGVQDQRKSLTAQVYLWRIRKYLGAYLAVAGPARAVIFTDSIGENVPFVRWTVCTDMESFGLAIDNEKNENPGELPADVSTPGSAVRVLVIRTNEELAIARHTYHKLSDAGGEN